jgi:hypothetical protein
MSKQPARRRRKQRRSGWGGARPGSGPKKGTVLSAVELRSAEAAEIPAEIDAAAAPDALVSISSLANQVRFGVSEAAVISASVAILDRGYGKPGVEIGGDAMLPFMMKPAAPSVSSAVREEARKHAMVAIAALRKIRDHGQSETARVSAAKALLDRGLGTVAAARMLDEFDKRPLGKKEEAQRAAESAAKGRYATPAPPKSLQ